jgi:hypothetical protein
MPNISTLNYDTIMSNLVDFIIIGAAKCGTTAALINLRKHPKIHMPQDKEPHFFDLAWSAGVQKYKRVLGPRPPNVLVGEKTPSYLSFFPAHRNMSVLVPDAKLIMFLRNPISRAFSHWNHFRQRGHDQDFAETIRRCIINLGDVRTYYDSIKETPDTYLGVDVSFMNLVNRGLYADHIENLLQFFPKEQLHVVISERAKANMTEEYDKVLSFLGLKPVKDVKYENYASNIYEGHVIDEPTKYLLEKFFKPHNERLFEFLGEEIPEWS